MSTFPRWLTTMLKENERDVVQILRDETALHFLIAWALFESKCFRGFLSAKDLRQFATRTSNEGFRVEQLRDALSHFHQRYQSKSTLGRLLHDDRNPKAVVSAFEKCLGVPTSSLPREDQIFFVAFVLYRYRNNMFHGNKGVESWLQFRHQIQLCTGAMQMFVAHAESLIPSMPIPIAA